MILLHAIVEILDLADGDRGAVLLVVALDGRFIGRAAVNGDLLRHAVAADRLGQEAFGRLLVALLREEKVNRLPHFIDSTIEIALLALHLDVGLVHAPTHPNRALTPMKGVLEQRAILDGPPVDRRVINVHPTFLHEFLDVACAQRVRYIPAHPHENDFFREMGTLKTDRHRLAPSCITVGHRRRAYRKLPPMKTCDKTRSSRCMASSCMSTQRCKFFAATKLKPLWVR